MAGVQIYLDPAPRSVPLARRWLLDMLGPEPPYDVEVARLLVSELVTNAVLHARTAFTVEVSEERSTLRISVCDSADSADRGAPTAAVASDDGDESGRGLQIVQLLASRWGVDANDDGGATVWFELSAEPESNVGCGDQLSA